MRNFLFSKKVVYKKVTFATSCWENNWKDVLEEKKILSQLQKYNYPFEKKLLVINNITEKKPVFSQLEKLQEKKVFTDVIYAPEKEEEILAFFSLKKKDFIAKDARKEFQVTDDWVFYNALAPLAAIYACQTEYLLYVTSDVFLIKNISWIEKALYWMEKNPAYKVANLLWNNKKKEAKLESFQKKGDFWVAQSGFSDQMFLVRTQDFQGKIYSEIRKDASHFPRGEVFEKRVYSYMKNHNWLRLTYRKGSYFHQ